MRRQRGAFGKRFSIWLAGIATATLAACGGSTGPAEVPAGAGTMADQLVAPAAERPPGLLSSWRTDFSKRSVSFSELIQGQIKDGIPAISKPRFLSVADTDFLGEREPVVAFELDGDARAYPLQILIWHEIVNDVVGGMPVLITFCPLCNTAIAFDRRLGGAVLDFGVSGYLRNSDLVMFDRETESWWQQVTGEAIVGELTGARLQLLPSSIVAWSDFRDAFPMGRVLSRNTGHARPYGQNPYVGYDDVASSPFLFDGKPDGRLAPMERVATVEIGGETAAYPFGRLALAGVVHDRVGGTEIVVFFKQGTASALDRSAIASSRDVGAAAVYLPRAGGRTLTFRADGEGFVDLETGSRWSILGRATSGALRGEALEPVVSGNHFWFAWAAFKPETRIWTP